MEDSDDEMSAPKPKGGASSSQKKALKDLETKINEMEEVRLKIAGIFTRSFAKSFDLFVCLLVCWFNYSFYLFHFFFFFFLASLGLFTDTFSCECLFQELKVAKRSVAGAMKLADVARVSKGAGGVNLEQVCLCV